MNCTVQCYLILGIFTKRNIKKGEEISIECRWENYYSTTNSECHFKSPTFRGIFEVKSKSNKTVDKYKSFNSKPPSKNKAVVRMSTAKKVAKNYHQSILMNFERHRELGRKPYFFPLRGKTKDQVRIKGEIIYFEESVLKHEPTPKVASLVFSTTQNINSTKEQLTFLK